MQNHIVIERGVTITGDCGKKTEQARDKIWGRATWERDDRKFSPGRSSWEGRLRKRSSRKGA